jgi:hypothetical protein
MKCIIALAATMSLAQAQLSGVLIRSEITEQSPKFGKEFSFTQKIPMVTGEMVVVYAKPEKGMSECYRRFISKEGKADNPNHWICSRGSSWLLQGTTQRSAKAIPVKGGSPFAFTMNASDETTLHVAEADGILEVQMRSSSPTSFFFLMGKTKVGPPQVFKDGHIEPTDPWLGNGYRYQEHAFHGRKGAGLIVELRRPSSTPSQSLGENLGVVTPAGETLYMDNLMDDDCARVFIGSMTDGDYIIQPRVIGSKGLVPVEKLNRANYIVTTREVPDMLKLLGIQFITTP